MRSVRNAMILLATGLCPVMALAQEDVHAVKSGEGTAASAITKPAISNAELWPFLGAVVNFMNTPGLPQKLKPFLPLLTEYQTAEGKAKDAASEKLQSAFGNFLKSTDNIASAPAILSFMNTLRGSQGLLEKMKSLQAAQAALTDQEVKAHGQEAAFYKGLADEARALSQQLVTRGYKLDSNDLARIMRLQAHFAINEKTIKTANEAAALHDERINFQTAMKGVEGASEARNIGLVNALMNYLRVPNDKELRGYIVSNMGIGK